MPFFIKVYRVLKSCTSLLENVSLRVPPSNLRGFSLFCACPSNKHCPPARCAYVANVVDKDLDIFALGAVSLNYDYTLFILLIVDIIIVVLLLLLLLSFPQL
jgi:hypothetical protein